MLTTGISGCVQCEAGAPHRLHARITDNMAVFTDDDGNIVPQPSTTGVLCPFCNQQVSFIDPEFSNAFCLPCQWMGEVDGGLRVNGVEP